MTAARFRNGERILFFWPSLGWTIAEVVGEDRSGGAYIAAGKVEGKDIAGAVPDFADEAALLAQMDAVRITRASDIATARRRAWDGYWDALETAGVQRVPGNLPTF